MHYLFLLALLLLASLVALKAQTPASSAKPEHYEVFLLAGQSNMDGRAEVKELTGDLEPWTKPQSNVWIAFRAGGLHRALTLSDGPQPLCPGYSGTWPTNTVPPTMKHPFGTFGPEVSFGATMAQALPGRKILLIKSAEGGTNLLNDWAPNAKGMLYEQFITFAQQTLKELQDQGSTYTLRGMIWHQGESDANLQPDQYQERLTAFIGHVRSDMQSKDLPFVIGEIYDNGKKQEDVIRAAQKATAESVPNAGFASAQGLTTKDGVHFIAPSQIELGQRFGQAMISLCKLNAP